MTEKRMLIFKMEVPTPERIERWAAARGYIVTDVRPARGDERLIDSTGEVVLHEEGCQIWIASIVCGEEQ